MEQHEQRVIDHYTAVLTYGEQMLQSANDGAWDDLISHEGDYVEVIETLAQIEQGTQLDADGRKAKLDLLMRIRDNEQQLRTMLQERMNELSELMTQSRTQLRVHEAYERNSIAR